LTQPQRPSSSVYKLCDRIKRTVVGPYGMIGRKPTSAFANGAVGINEDGDAKTGSCAWSNDSDELIADVGGVEVAKYDVMLRQSFGGGAIYEH
jgi:hypothetical protein